ncbi:MAG: PqqD family protein [Candidatus Thermoplasmatota archaeon]
MNKSFELIPIRNVDWKMENNLAVIVHKKNFSRLEKFLFKYLGGTEYIRRPLDKIGTKVWELCDGKHNVLEICKEMDSLFKEEIEPVVPRVTGFLKLLAERNYIIFKKPSEI